MVNVMTVDLDTSTVFVTMALIAMTARVALFKLTSRGSDPHLQTSTATNRHQYTRDYFGILPPLICLHRDDFGIPPPLICLQRQQEMRGMPIALVTLEVVRVVRSLCSSTSPAALKRPMPPSLRGCLHCFILSSGRKRGTSA